MIPFVVGAALVQAMAAPVPFGVGESYEYRGHYGFISVGDASLTVVAIENERGVPSWHLNLTTHASVIGYNGDSKLDSWTGVSDFVSRRFVHYIKENGKITADDDFHIYADSGYYRNHSDTLTKPTPRNALDDLAFIYYLRTLDYSGFKKDSVYRIPRYFRDDHNPVEVTLLGHDSIEMPDGSHCWCVLLHPMVDESNGLFSRKSDARLWLTDDGLRIPVQIKAKLPVIGYASLTLRKITRRN
jgi:hypothetical protein